MKLTTIISDIEAHHSPRAWDRVVIKLIPKIKSKGYFIHSFKGDIDIDRDFIHEIDDNLKSMYGNGLSSTLVN